MDSATNNLSKISIVEGKTMIGKLHNMQWLKNTSHLPYLGKSKAIHKQKQKYSEDNKIEDKDLLIEDSKSNSIKESDECYPTTNTYAEHLLSETMSENTSHSPYLGKSKAIYMQKQKNGEDNKVEDKDLLMEDSESNLIEESDECCPITNTYAEHLLNDTMSENIKHTKNENINAENIFTNQKSIIQKVTKEEVLNIATVEDTTTKLEIQCCIVDKKQKNSETLSENIVKDNAEDDVCSNFSNSQNQNSNKLNLIKHSDNNNNHSDSNKTREMTDEESNKALTKENKEDACTKKTPKKNIKTGNNIAPFKSNEKYPTSAVDSKKIISNQSKLSNPNDKQKKVERFNNKHIFMKKNTCTKEQESINKQQTNISKNGIENNAKDIAVKSNFSKTDLEVELDKTAEVSQSDQKLQNSSLNVSSNKDKISTKQRTTVSKQLVSKSRDQESSKKNTSTLNRTVDKSVISEKTEKVTSTSRNCDLPMNESERKNEKVNVEKNVQNEKMEKKVNRDVNFRRNNTFVTQYKNSTFLKPMQTKNMPGNTEYSPNYGRNLSRTRNNIVFERTENTECREVSKMKKDYTLTDTSPRPDVETEEFSSNNSEIGVKPSDMHDVSAFNDKINVNSVKEEGVCLTKNEESANSNVDRLKKEPMISEHYRHEITINDSKIDQQYVETSSETINEKTNLPKYSSNTDKSIVESQSNPINQHQFEVKNIQRTDDSNKSENNYQSGWNNDSAQSNVTAVNVQQSIPYVHFQPAFAQSENYAKQMLVRGTDHGKFYDQRSLINDAMRLPQIMNTFDAAPCEYNLQATSSDGNVTAASIFESTMDNNRVENSNALHRYSPNVQQRPFLDYTGYSIPGHSNRWSPSMQDAFHAEQFVKPTQQPATMHVYNSATFSPDDFNNIQATNCLIPHPVLYTTSSPCMQTWNPQLQYPMPVYHNSPCPNYAVFPNMVNQANNYNDVNGPMCMQHQQHKYINYLQLNSNVANAGPDPQAHANPNYVKDTRGSDPNLDTRNVAENAPMRSAYTHNRYYRKNQDYRPIYDAPQYSPSVSYPRSQQPFVPATGINQFNTYRPPHQKYYKPNSSNYIPFSRSQRTQNLACEDNGQEDIRPIISPKEFITGNVNFSTKADQFTTRVFKSDFKRPNTGYRQPPLQRYNNGFRPRNPTYQDFSKEYSSPANVVRGGMLKPKKT